MAILLGIHLQRTQEFLFFFREKLMVFYYNTDIIWARYHGVGGIGLLISHWLTQFFVYKYVGAVVTSILGVASAALLWMGLPKSTRSVIVLPLCLFPIIFQCDALFDVYYYYYGIVAFFLFALFTFCYRCIYDCTESDNLRLIAATLLSFVLFYIGGAVGFLLSLYIFIVEVLERIKSSWKFIFPVAIIAMVGGYCVSNAYLPRYRDVFTNGAYYEPIIEPSNFFHTSWIIVLIVALIAPLCNMLEKRLKTKLYYACPIVIIALLSLFSINSAKRNQQKMYAMIAMDHYITSQDTKGLLASPYCNNSNFIMMNRVNYALAREGRLLDDFFHYHQLAPNSLMHNLKDLALDVEITSTVSEFYYIMDNIASADERAFNSYEGLRYGSPNNLQMLVRTSLIFGRYQIAEKFIKMLEETMYYKDWATAQRKFLYNDEAVLADPEYGNKRRSLPTDTREFVQAHGPFADLLLTIRTNPKATVARDYAIAYLLLANDIPHINAFINEFYGTEVLPKVPLRLQEAVLAANETDLDFCRAHGVEESTIEEYRLLKSTMLQARNTNAKAEKTLARWRHTYWYYLLITSPNFAKMREQMRLQEEANAGNLPELS